MNTKGFKQYQGLSSVVYPQIAKRSHPVSDVKTPADHVLDLIFSTDEFGWPNTSVEVMLSDKTSDEVRQFIEKNLMGVRSDVHLVNDPAIVAEYNNLESDFIAKCSRNRYETVEQYEERLRQIVEDDKQAEMIKMFHDKLSKMTTKNDI
jgi:hypothetical protein